MRPTRVPFVVASCLALAGSAAAQIDLFDWTLAGDPTGSGFTTPGHLHVTGTDSLDCVEHVTWFETVLPVGGTLSVLLDFQNLDSAASKGHTEYDGPVWVIDGVYAFPPKIDGPSGGSGWPTGAYTLEFEAEAGQHVGFGVWSLDCIEGPGVADFHDLVFTPKPWSTHVAALDPRVLWSAPEPLANPVLAAAGDVDLDGRTDVVLGGYLDFQWRLRLVSGADGATLLTIPDPLGSVQAVAGVGDMDGDGQADFAAGHPFDTLSGPSIAGSVTVHSGADGSLLMQATGTAAWDELGDEVAGVGDIDLDGVPDVAVRLAKVFSSKSEVRVLSGATGALIYHWLPPTPSITFGKALAGPGDLTGDGVPDILVGAASAEPGVVLFSGATGHVAKTFANPGLGSFGAAVAGAGDVDGDGTGDIVVGGPLLTGGFAVFSGASASLLSVGLGSGTGEEFGSAVAGGQDVDGDGRLDVTVGAPGAAPGGAVRVFDALDGSLQVELVAAQPKQQLGRAVIEPADLDSDGLGDVVALALPFESLLPPSVRAWSKLQHAGPPTLDHSGDPIPGQTITVTLANALPGAPGFLVLGGALVDVPVAGGVLAPSADLVFPIVVGPAGAAAFSGSWPAGLPVWTTVWMQAWMADPAGPKGFSASDALAASQL